MADQKSEKKRKRGGITSEAGFKQERSILEAKLQNVFQ